MRRNYFVYILASRYRGTLYTGVTSDLVRRVVEHREGLIEGFTRPYGVKTLVHWELHDNPIDAINREKVLKRWRRAWKFRVMEERNPDWLDLTPSLMNDVPRF